MKLESWNQSCNTLAVALNLGNPNHATSETSTSIASGQAQLMAALAQVIFIGVHDNSPTQNWVGPSKGNLAVGDVNFSDAFRIGDNISQVASVSVVICRPTMGLALGIEVWSGRGAAVGVVTELMNVKSVLAGCQLAHFTADFDRAGVALQ